MKTRYIKSWKLLLLGVPVLFAYGAVGARLYVVQVVRHAELVEESENARKRIEVIEARRGDILDSRGTILATVEARYDIGVDPHSFNPDEMGRLGELAEALKVPVGKVQTAVTSLWRETADGSRRKVRWRELVDGTDEATYHRVMDLGIKGVYGNRKYVRTYPGGQLGAHVIGFVNLANSSVMGIERAMDFYLSGQRGWRELERDGDNRELSHLRNREVRPNPGLNVQLTIDAAVQNMVETEIAHLGREYDPETVSVIVSDPATGFIIAMANYPTFDSNRFWEYPMATQRNRAVTDVYEPGSTFKIIPAVAALNEGLVEAETIFDCSFPVANYRGRTVRLPGDHDPFQKLSVAEIVIKSSNRGAAYLGMILGERRLYDYARRFGFGETSGLGLDGEVSGILHPVRNWDGLTITRLPMGHAISVTPIQIHSAISAVANGGRLMRPQVVDRILDAEGETILQFDPQERREVVRPESARLVTGFMTEVVSVEGTARRASLDGFAVAGKTGTTQMIVDGQYSRQHHVASFSGFFPARNPRFAITVMVADPKLKGVGYGGLVAAPAFRRIAEGLVQYYRLEPDAETNQNLLAGIEAVGVRGVAR